MRYIGFSYDNKDQNKPKAGTVFSGFKIKNRYIVVAIAITVMTTSITVITAMTDTSNCCL